MKELITVKTVITRSAAAVGTSFLGVLLLTGPANAKDIGPGEPLAASMATHPCSNVVPEDLAACLDAYNIETAHYEGPIAPASVPPNPNWVSPGALGLTALGAVVIGGVVITTVGASHHRHATRPA
ncbi:hypothetical protein JNB_08879 [Janibacter sp. HTCC2649]|uniref:hypothetical protein n=1 Tax=Janibacter sp. HTCC2649 TaxID=313589 RepID=UPI0000670864|nr:hypothetical protein [Janibacter sp. HTCC2649]EAQ00273.1 hypothetical protein JNB_08879 [Janibacter sp. HTCC2649]